MKASRASLFISHQPSMKWLTGVIDYISASFMNPNLWTIIQEISKEKIGNKWAQLEKQNISHSMSVAPYSNPDMFFSIEFYLSLLSELERDKSNDINGSKVYSNTIRDDAGGHLHEIGEAFQLLLDTGILTIPYAIMKRDMPFGEESNHGSQHYTLNKNLAHYLIKNRLIYNHLFGFDYIIKRYTNSVFKIEVKGDDVTSIGTGWLYDVNTNNLESPVLRFVITNSHVVDGFKSIIVKNKSDTIIPHLSIDSFLTTDGIDIALIQIAYDNTAPPFVLEPNVPLLEDIITIGYPSVPLSREAYQLVHRGEVNALVTDYFNQELLIVSARTAPGNSGSPVIDDTGRVVGMVTQELFEKTAFEQKGITPYSACIPSTTILKAIMKSNTLKSYHF
jgi:hypothetical protein